MATRNMRVHPQALSELERQRLENIARNAQYLQDLGINTQVRTNRSNSSRKKGNVKSIVPDYEEPIRRSSRIASLPGNVNYKEDKIYVGVTSSSSSTPRSFEVVVNEKDLESTTKRRKIAHSSDLPTGTFISDQEIKKREQVPSQLTTNVPTIKPGFSSSMRADISYWCDPDRLSKPIEIFGKAAVMALSVRGTDGFSRSPNTSVRFNKFSGVAEWQNALFLWVNLPAEGTVGQFDNAFSAGGRHMMWFGGSTMHVESRVVQRLIHTSNRCAEQTLVENKINVKKEEGEKEVQINVSIPPSSASIKVKEENQLIKKEHETPKVITEDDDSFTHSENESHTILLFVRHEGEGYACLGRCSYVAMNLQAHPIEVKWNLEDYEKMKSIKYFQDLMPKLKSNK